MTVQPAAEETPAVAPNSVNSVIAGLVRAAISRNGGWTYETLAQATGLKPRRLMSWVHEGKEPSLSGALSLAMVLGENAVNAILGVISYKGAVPLDNAPADCPLDSAVAVMSSLSVFMRAASDRRIDHTEERAATEAADLIIAEMVPFSSAGKRA